jgi:hypothetical protein
VSAIAVDASNIFLIISTSFLLIDKNSMIKIALSPRLGRAKKKP